MGNSFSFFDFLLPTQDFLGQTEPVHLAFVSPGVDQHRAGFSMLSEKNGFEPRQLLQEPFRVGPELRPCFQEAFRSLWSSLAM